MCTTLCSLAAHYFTAVLAGERGPKGDRGSTGKGKDGMPGSPGPAGKHSHLHFVRDGFFVVYVIYSCISDS